MDEILEDSFDVNQLKRLAGYIAPYKKKMAGVILLMLSSSALTMAIPIFFQNVMDHSSALAREIRCFCPPESPTPRSPTIVSYPSGSAWIK